jgi:hypothetical protein
LGTGDPLLDLEERLDLRRQCRYRALIEVHQTLAQVRGLQAEIDPLERKAPNRSSVLETWFMRSKIAVDVLDDEILVTMPGTSFSIIYQRTKDNQLIASHFSGRKVQDERNKMSFPRFLSLAWTAANEKAREIGWIISRRSN